MYPHYYVPNFLLFFWLIGLIQLPATSFIRLTCNANACIFSTTVCLLAIGTTGKILYDIKNNKPHLPVKNNPPEKRILLVGDSIIDSPFWNDVGKKPLGEVLLDKLGDKGWTIDDRSTDEASTPTILNAIENKEPMVVRTQYVRCRDILGIPYDPHKAGTSRIKKYHTRNIRDGTMGVDIHSDVEGSHVVISLGGNDIGLLKNLNPYTLCNNLAKIGKFYKEQGAESVNLIYPYTPTPEMAGHNWFVFNALMVIHKAMKAAVCKTVQYSAIDHLIDLSDLGDEDRKGYAIPEPTAAGTKKISERVQDKLPL